MAQAQPIIIGDNFTRTYKRKTPAGVAVDWGTDTVAFVIKQGATIHRYTEAGGDLVVTPSTGTVVVNIPYTKTALLTPGVASSSYLEFTKSNGDVYIKGKVTRQRVHS